MTTPSAEGRLEAPWTLTGTARRVPSGIEYDLQFVFTAQGAAKPLAFTGLWEKAPALPPLDERMSLEGWTVHWLTPMTTTWEQGTTLDYGARPVSERWTVVAALRKYVNDEASRRALRRVPVDAAHPGNPETLTFEAFQVDRRGIRTAVGRRILEYRPGRDVLVEETSYAASSKTLPLGYGLSLSTDVYREQKLTGFGLVLEKDNSSCFSWEWFDHSNGAIFRKIRGGGHVRVSISGAAGSQELVAVAFLDDVTLQCAAEGTGVVEELRVKSGSVFRVKP
jgi:hypothetical protein